MIHVICLQQNNLFNQKFEETEGAFTTSKVLGEFDVVVYMVCDPAFTRLVTIHRDVLAQCQRYENSGLLGVGGDTELSTQQMP